jgi:hypothetical protein
LFTAQIDLPALRDLMLRAGELNWKDINPDVFGSMIQAVAEDDERVRIGHALYQRAQHSEGFRPIVHRRSVRPTRPGGRQSSRATEPQEAHLLHSRLRSSLGSEDPAEKRGWPASTHRACAMGTAASRGSRASRSKRNRTPGCRPLGGTIVIAAALIVIWRERVLAIRRVPVETWPWHINRRREARRRLRVATE